MSPASLLIGRAAVSFIASFLAIWVWSRTREESWLFIVTGILVSFIVLLIEILSSLSILPYSPDLEGRIPLWLGILQMVPYLFYALGFGFYIFRNRRF
ncbi:MAG: hypothetical protein PQJ58_10015 [Spirochaetales bacterium]|nr:hypothetical protein [Spirochaetales bacterium]